MHDHSMYDMNDDEFNYNIESLNDASNYDSRIDIEFAQYWQYQITRIKKLASEVVRCTECHNFSLEGH